MTIVAPFEADTVTNFSCYCGESHDCDEVSDTYSFNWNSYGVLTFPLCHFHYNKILEANDGIPPDAEGNDHDEAVEFILEYLEPPKETECCGKCYSECSGTKKKRVFVWHFRNRAKYGGEEYMTTLAVNMCEKHFAKLLEKNEGKKPMAIGWDYWEALDSILYTLDEKAPQYETMQQQLLAIEPLLQSGLLAISLPQKHNVPSYTP